MAKTKIVRCSLSIKGECIARDWECEHAGNHHYIAFRCGAKCDGKQAKCKIVKK